MASPQTWATNADTSSDAGFRAWGAEFGTFAALCGLVQTADTGQVNWTTATRGATNYYEIWRFVDSSVFMKVEYNNPASTGTLTMFITFGTGSNGSGTLTGQSTTRGQISGTDTIASTITAYQSWMSRTADSFTFNYKAGGSSGAGYSCAYFTVGKTVDGSGVATTTGYAAHRLLTNAAPSFVSVRTVAPAATFNDNNSGFCAIPGLPTSSITTAGAFQAYEFWGNWPEVQPYIWNNAVLTAEIPRGVTFQCAMAGATLRTYLSLGSVNGSGNVSNFAQATYNIAMLYE